MPPDLDPATGRGRRGLPGDTGLADARRTHHIHDGTAATDCAVHHFLEGHHLPVPTHQARLGAPGQVMPRRDPQQPARCHRLAGPLDVHSIRFGQHDDVLDEARSRFRQHHPTRRGRRPGTPRRGTYRPRTIGLAAQDPTRGQYQCH
jgi:hypothetical protein